MLLLFSSSSHFSPYTFPLLSGTDVIAAPVGPAASAKRQTHGLRALPSAQMCLSSMVQQVGLGITVFGMNCISFYNLLFACPGDRQVSCEVSGPKIIEESDSRSS